MSVGLDIGSKAIKMVELDHKGGDSFTLKSAGAIGYSGDTIDKMEDEKTMTGLSEVIKKLIHDTKISSKKVSLSMPESLSFTRLVKFPLLNDQEIASAVRWEAEEYIPIPISEAIVEHQIVERKEVGNPPQVLVMLVAVQRSLVEKYVKVVGMAGLSVVGVETELLSLTRSLAPPEKSAVLVDFGSKSTDIAVTRNGQLFLARSISMAGEAFTRAVAQSLGVRTVQAEEYKKAYGLAEDKLEGKVGRALAPTFKVVTEEIKKAIHFYQTEAKGEVPSSVVLTGGSAAMPGAVTSIAKLLGIEVLLGNPFAKISLDPDSAKSLAGYHSLYGVAVGLAMRGE